VVNYQSGNYQKYKNPNPIQRWLILRFYNAIIDIIAKINGDSLLDAGCGEGLSIQKIARKRQEFRIYGMDLSFTAIQLAKKIHNQSIFIQGSILNLPFKDDSFQVVICLEVLEHLEQPEQGLREISRVSESFILLSVPNEPYFKVANFLRGKNLLRWGDDIGHLQHWSAIGFINFINRHTKVLSWQTSFPWTIALCKKTISNHP
jgi:2-polyprenyl-3-methyl-5-hydroxy-6-metoxy-1,4-benzoquinol methylase